MSYIFDALKKVEDEHEVPQSSVDNDIEEYKRWRFFPQTRFWYWIAIMVLLNILSFTILFWPKKPLVKPHVYIVAPTTVHDVSE